MNVQGNGGGGELIQVNGQGGGGRGCYIVLIIIL